MARLRALQVLAVACGGAAAPDGADGTDGTDGADGTDGTDGSDGTDGGDGTDGTDPDVTVGGFALAGDARDWPGDALVADGCVAWMDVTAQASGGAPTLSAPVEVDGAGAWRLAEVPRGSTVGLFLVFDDCDTLATGLPDADSGRAGDWAATAIHVPTSAWAHLGPDDTLGGLTVRALSQAARLTLEAELADAGAWFDTTEGLLFGRVLDIDGEPLHNGRVRGPSGTQILYQQAPGDWLPWESTTPEGDGLFAVPAPAWSSWLCSSPVGIYDPLLAGGLPHLMLYRDCVPAQPR